jgi:hypothetical protein
MARHVPSIAASKRLARNGRASDRRVEKRGHRSQQRNRGDEQRYARCLFASGGTVLIAQVPDDQLATARDILRRDGAGVAPGTPKSSTAETVRGESPPERDAHPM